jgi:16S rRNA (adenine1518-N6/adenine1519-N6)-dimethyltransferase
MLQREVAQRLAARPGSGDWGVLSACQQLRANVELLLALPPGAFRPAPKVHSAVVRVTYRPPNPAVKNVAVFDALVRSVFMQRRKMLVNALERFAATYGIDAAAALDGTGLDGRRRPETLEVAELAGLSDVFASA